jgi:phosphoribosylcarboxyaminoimidazole (NCAIR) mutase
MMDETEWARLAQVAQEGFTKLLQDLQAAGASEKQALTVILSMAQLRAHLAGVVVEHTNLPGEEKQSLN